MITQEELAELQLIKDEVETLSEQRKELIEEFKALQSRIGSINDTVRELTARRDMILDRADPIVPRVSDHALVRYLERAANIDLESIRAKLLKGRISTIQQLKTCRFKTSDGMILVVEDGVMVTVIPANEGRVREAHERYDLGPILEMEE